MLATALRPDPGSQGWAFRLEAQTRFAHRVEELPLAPLRDEAARALIDELVPPAWSASRSGRGGRQGRGQPLYLEELLRALLETGGDRRRTWTITPKTAAELPPALEALLVARIDRLEPGARRLAQVAAVVGREFPVSVAAAVAGSADGDIAELLRAEIVARGPSLPELECTFRHGLLQEAALSTLTPTSQRELYGRIGHAMEAHLGDQVDERLDQLAFYFYRSDETDKGLAYLERAAEHAVDRSRRSDERSSCGSASDGSPNASATGTAWSTSTAGSRGCASDPAVSSSLPRCRDREAAPARAAAVGPAVRGVDGEATRRGCRPRTRSRCAYAVAVGGRFSGSFGERLQDRPRQALRRLGAVRARVGWLGVQVRAREVEHRLVRERRAARGAFVREAAQRVDVRRAGRLRAAGASRARGSRASP